MMSYSHAGQSEKIVFLLMPLLLLTLSSLLPSSVLVLFTFKSSLRKQPVKLQLTAVCFFLEFEHISIAFTLTWKCKFGLDFHRPWNVRWHLRVILLFLILEYTLADDSLVYQESRTGHYLYQLSNGRNRAYMLQQKQFLDQPRTVSGVCCHHPIQT